MENLKLVLLDSNNFVYVVEDGDTLRGIAEEFSTTEQLIICDNFLKKPIKAGDRLYIKRYSKIYVVTPYDSIKSIALKFGTTAERIFVLNKISYIYVGERIVIP